MRLLVLLATVSLTLSGCTVIGAGAAAGGTALTNLSVPESFPDSERTNVGKAALVGAAIGLVIDILVIKAIDDGFRKKRD